MPSIRVGFAVPSGPEPASYRQLLRFGRMVGLDTLLLWDHFEDFAPRSIWQRPGFAWMAKGQPSPHSQTDPVALAASMVRSAGRVRMGVGVTDALRHHPVSIARSFLTLATLARRPPILGLGAGERMNVEPYGIAFDHPVGRLEEAVQILRACFDSPGSIDFSGEYFHLDGAPFDLEVPGRKPEIWVAAQGPRMLDIAGRYADGWLPAFGVSPERYESALGAVRAAARQAGRDPASITPGLQVPLVIAPSAAEARRALDASFTRLVVAATQSAETWRWAGYEHPLGASYRGFVDVIPERMAPELERAMEDIPHEVAAAACIWGTIDDVVASIRLLGDAGLRFISLIPTSYMVSRKLAAYTLWALPTLIRRLQRG